VGVGVNQARNYHTIFARKFDIDAIDVVITDINDIRALEYKITVA
jgi:citrate lyase beta subunit